VKDFSYVSESIEIYIKTMIKCVAIVRRFSQLSDMYHVCIESLEKMKVIFGRALNAFHNQSNFETSKYIQFNVELTSLAKVILVH
jgi:hypothetical protein